MLVVYDGPFDAVEIAENGLVAERGRPVDVTNELGKLLCEQECWSRPGKAKEDK